MNESTKLLIEGLRYLESALPGQQWNQATRAEIVAEILRMKAAVGTAYRKIFIKIGQLRIGPAAAGK